MLALVLLAWQWLDARSERQALRQELARRLAEFDAQNREARVIAAQAQDEVRDVQVKVGVLEDKLARSQNQQVALETLYQELSAQPRRLVARRDRADRADCIPAACSSPTTCARRCSRSRPADSRLQRVDKPQLIPLRKVIAKDIERLKSLPYVDTVGISVRLDTLLGQVDGLPLAMEVRPTGGTRPPCRLPVDETAWQRVMREALTDFKQMVRVQRARQDARCRCSRQSRRISCART